MSYTEFTKKLDCAINSLWRIKTKITLLAKQQAAKFFEKQEKTRLNEIWKKYEDILMDGLIMQIQEEVKVLMSDQEANQSLEKEEHDFSYMMSHMEQSPQDEERWKTFLKFFRSGQATYIAHGEDLTHLKQKYLDFSNKKSQENKFLENSFNYQINNENPLNQFQFLQKAVQTINETHDRRMESYHDAPNSPTSQEKYRNQSPSSVVKENFPFLSSTDQSSNSVNYHRFAMNSLTILAYALKSMQYLLPVGYLSEVMPNLMNCRTNIGNYDHLQEKQFDDIERIYKKVYKKIKTFRKEMKNDYQNSKLLNINQNIVLKIN